MGSGLAASGALVGKVAPCGLARAATRPTGSLPERDRSWGILGACVAEAWTQQLSKSCEANKECDFSGCATHLDSFNFHLTDEQRHGVCVMSRQSLSRDALRRGYGARTGAGRVCTARARARVCVRARAYWLLTANCCWLLTAGCWQPLA